MGDAKKIWEMIFYICLVLYIVNVLCVLFSGNCMFIKTVDVYNYISVMLNAVFLYIFYNFLRKGALTTRYLVIMFCALVLFPFLIALATGGVKI